MMNGIINIYKEKGFTSFDVVAKLRGILKTRKIGHTGTLDPDAEGVLPVCIGKATKICELLTDKTKEYEAVMLLGRTTDTQDVTGETLTQQEVRCSAKEVEKAVLSFAGDYMQVPPMYSALKVVRVWLPLNSSLFMSRPVYPAVTLNFRFLIISHSTPKLACRWLVVVRRYSFFAESTGLKR